MHRTRFLGRGLDTGADADGDCSSMRACLAMLGMICAAKLRFYGLSRRKVESAQRCNMWSLLIGTCSERASEAHSIDMCITHVLYDACHTIALLRRVPVWPPARLLSTLYFQTYTFGRLVVRATKPALMGATVRDAPHCNIQTATASAAQCRTRAQSVTDDSDVQLPCMQGDRDIDGRLSWPLSGRVDSWVRLERRGAFCRHQPCAHLLAPQEHDARGAVPVQKSIWAFAAVAEHVPARSTRVEVKGLVGMEQDGVTALRSALAKPRAHAEQLHGCKPYTGDASYQTQANFAAALLRSKQSGLGVQS